MKANMKRIVRSMAMAVCSFALIAVPFIEGHGTSLFFYGEPKHPDCE